MTLDGFFKMLFFMIDRSLLYKRHYADKCSMKSNVPKQKRNNKQIG